MKHRLTIWSLIITLTIVISACSSPSSTPRPTTSSGTTEEASSTANGATAEVAVDATPTFTRPPRPTRAPTPVPGTYAFEVTGSVGLTLGAGNERVRTLFEAARAQNNNQGVEVVPATYRLRIADGTTTVVIQWPQSFESGEYEITQDPHSIVVTFVTGDGTTNRKEYNLDVGGTVTLTITDGMASGELDFTGTTLTRTSNQQEVRETVHVTGTFSDWGLPPTR